MNLFQTSKSEKLFPHLRLQENRTYAFAYYLDSVLPMNGLVEVIAPKEILSSLLPMLAKEKNCRVKCKNTSRELRNELARLGILESNGTPDLTLTEPDFLVEGGALVLPEHVCEASIIGIASLEKWTTKNPSTHDFVPLRKIITEAGILLPNDMKSILSGVL